MMVVGVMALALATWLVMAFAIGTCVSIAWYVIVSRPAFKTALIDDRWHAVDRERWLLALLTAPVVLPSAMLSMMMAPGLFGLVVPALDHCLLHPEHPHLCLIHPGAVLPVWICVFIGLTAAMCLGRTGLVFARTCAQSLHLRSVIGVSRGSLSKHVDLVECAEPLALTLGMFRPCALVTTGLASMLDANQVSVVVAHEEEHARRRDPLRQQLARLCSFAIWPQIRSAMMDELKLAAEQACDEVAALRLKDRLIVASTLLRVERIFGGGVWSSVRPLGKFEAGVDLGLGGAVGVAGGALASRVESLLAAPRNRRSDAWRLAFILLPTMVFGARELHHEIEHLMAWALGIS